VPFHDVDSMGIVWHGNYLKYFEVARDALFSSYGVDLYGPFGELGRHEFLFPIVRTATKHVFPLRFGDRFRCRAELLEARAKLVVGFTIRLVDGDKVCARGRTEQVAIRGEDLGLELSIPSDIREAFGVDG